MNKNAIGLHKFSRIFFGGMMQGLPHAPCRLQRGKEKCNEISASLPPHAPCRLQRFINSTDEIEVHLCLHTLRADCNGKEYRKPASHNLCLHTLRADCNIVHANRFRHHAQLCLHTLRADCNHLQGALTVPNQLCLHTLRADCNADRAELKDRAFLFASTRSVQIATCGTLAFIIGAAIFASTRSVQIATSNTNGGI